MPDNHHTEFHRKVSAAGLLIAMGIVFGDIGTSPLYTYTAVFHEGEVINATKALGVLSAVFWTLFLLTTVKYIFIVLRADNNGEGGIFSLYALVRRYFGKWLVIPAIIGAAFLIADGIITPPISVASAIEGLQKFNPRSEYRTLGDPDTWLLLFLFQQTGTGNIGKVFGPVMLDMVFFHWYYGGDGDKWKLANIKSIESFLCILFIERISREVSGYSAVFFYAQQVLKHCIAIWVMWVVIIFAGAGCILKFVLCFSYAGQTAWLVSHKGETLGNISPFYSTIPSGIYIFAVIIATLATIIASQALISGCFTLVNEGIRLNIWPRHKVNFPERGQRTGLYSFYQLVFNAGLCWNGLVFPKINQYGSSIRIECNTDHAGYKFSCNNVPADKKNCQSH